MSDYVPPPILIDTREQQPWEFTRRSWASGSVVQGLKTGDYTLLGLEDVFTIDRKGKVTELAGNLTQARFERELERMEGFKHPFIVCDFPIEDLLDYPRVAAVPPFLRKKIRVSGAFLMSVLERYWLTYKTKWVFSAGRGREVALGMFKRVAALYAPPEEPASVGQ